jgi:hypothetical protein
MPQNPILVYLKDGGIPTYMHTVDAREGALIGDYDYAQPGGEEASPEERASAMSRFKTGQGMTHPELQTPEERDAARAKANEEAALMAGVPAGASVVVMAPGKGEGAAAPRSGSAATRSAAPANPTPPAHPAPSSQSTPRKD